MNLNNIINLLSNNYNKTLINSKLINNINNPEINFKEYLKASGYSDVDIEAENLRNDIETKLQNFSFGSSKIKLNISPNVYKRMVTNPSFKKKMNEIIDDFLSETGELSWMTKEARAGGGEISLTIDSKGNTTYTGKLYCIPGWEDTTKECTDSKELSKKLLALLPNSTLQPYSTDIIKSSLNPNYSIMNNYSINQIINSSEFIKNNFKKN